MFRLDADDMAALETASLGQATNRQVVAFRRAAGEDDLPGTGVNRLGDGASRLIHGLLAFPSEHVARATGVAELLAEIGQHRVDHARIDARRGMVVQIDGGVQHGEAFLFIRLIFDVELALRAGTLLTEKCLQADPRPAFESLEV